MNAITKGIKDIIEGNKVKIAELEQHYKNTDDMNRKVEIIGIIEEYKENNVKFNNFIKQQ